LEEDGSIGGCSDFTGSLGERWCFDWKFGFIENNIAGKVYFVRVRIKTSVATLVGTIADKYAGLTSEGELMSSIGTKKGVTEATKGTEQCVVRFFLEKFEERGSVVCD
jgi:hypothetical protein